jgi:glycosyltransferase involved in cell wall biosynthesis
VSVVLGFAQAPLERLLDSLDSVLAQQGVVLECVAVADGWPGAGVLQALHALRRRDPRLRLVLQPHGGLTRALRRGCRLARGEAIARIDVGDRMLPGRLQRQWQLCHELSVAKRLFEDLVVGGLERGFSGDCGGLRRGAQPALLLLLLERRCRRQQQPGMVAQAH